MGFDDINLRKTKQHMVRRIRDFKAASVESSKSLVDPVITSKHKL